MIITHDDTCDDIPREVICLISQHPSERYPEAEWIDITSFEDPPLQKRYVRGALKKEDA